MRLFQSVFLAILSLVLIACNEITFEDGRVPEPYRSEFTPYEGDYYGQFLGQTGRLRFAFDGDYALLTFRGDDGLDLLLGCESFIGRILSATARDHNGFSGGLSSVRFDFYPGHCAFDVEGREFILDFFTGDLPVRVATKVVRSPKEVYTGEFHGPRRTR